MKATKNMAPGVRPYLVRESAEMTPNASRDVNALPIDTLYLIMDKLLT